MDTEKNTIQHKVITVFKSPWGIVGIAVSAAIVLAIFILLPNQSKKMMPAQQHENHINNAYPTTDPAMIASTLSFKKYGQSADIIIDTHSNAVSGVQLNISYDPKILTTVQLLPGTFFDNPNTLLNSIDTTKGIISYAVAIKPSAQQKKGKGVIATILFQPVSDTTGYTRLTFLSQTKITSEGINSSVLKTFQGIILP